MMIDAHIHIALDGADWRQAKARHVPQPDDAWLRALLEDYAAAGYTYLRDGGDKWGVSERAAQLAGDYGIHYASPVVPLYPQGHYGGFLGVPFDGFSTYCTLVDQLLFRGASFVKLMLSGILDFKHYGSISSPGLPAEDVARMVAYAHQKGLPVMAHVNGSTLISDALDAGVDSIEHGLLMDAATCRKLARSRAVWVPTLAPVYAARESGVSSSEVLARICQEHAAAVAAVAAQGGLVASGSDAGSSGVPHVVGGQRERELLSLDAGTVKRGARALQDRFCARLTP